MPPQSCPRTWAVLLSEGVDERGHVVAQGLELIVGDAGRPSGAAVAAHVGRHGPVAGRRQRRHQVAVLVRGLRKAVEEEDQWPAALDLAVEPDPVRLDELGPHDRPMVEPRSRRRDEERPGPPRGDPGLPGSVGIRA